jgi:hypothetical protein
MLGYDISARGGALVVNTDEAARVRAIFDLYLEHGSLIPVVQELNRRNWCMKEWTTRKGTLPGGKPFIKNRLYNLLTNIVYTQYCSPNNIVVHFCFGAGGPRNGSYHCVLVCREPHHRLHQSLRRYRVLLAAESA